MEILTAIVLLMLIIYYRWVISIIVGIAVTIGGDLISGLIAGFVTYWLLKLIAWWIGYHIYKTAVDAQKHNQGDIK